METAATKKLTSFRLSKSLLDRLKAEARKENRSLNNYVECILLDTVYREPNEVTLAAMREAESGEELETLESLNIFSFAESDFPIDKKYILEPDADLARAIPFDEFVEGAKSHIRKLYKTK
jgi:hypothetical protein